mmetsp:Transcript_16438/g.33674  ORF Transcript_16438/g.33674 Transcript_16438/m.33674 type:complete len:403 (-) Transcript_16438:206-1414(-)
MLLSVPLKTTRRYDIGPPLASWVDATHPHYTSDQCRDDLLRLSSLRNCLADSICTNRGHAAALSGRALEDLWEYHACLLEAEDRGFPTTDDELVGSKDLRVSWESALGEERAVSRSNLRYERCCALFNVAALHSYRAAQEDHRGSKEGRSRAMRLHGKAAATLEHLRTELMAGPSADANPSADLTEPCLLMLESAERAQGQLCAYEAAAARPEPHHALLAKIAMGAADLYGEALAQSQDLLLRARAPGASAGWGARLKAAAMLFRARAERHDAEARRAAGEYGAEVARLRQAEFMAEEAAKFQAEAEVTSPGSPVSATSAVYLHEGGMGLAKHEIDWLRRTVRQRREIAERDNATVYHEKVPNAKELGAIRGQSIMAKLPPLDEELWPASLKRPIFSQLQKA